MILFKCLGKILMYILEYILLDAKCFKRSLIIKKCLNGGMSVLYLMRAILKKEWIYIWITIFLEKLKSLFFD